MNLPSVGEVDNGGNGDRCAVYLPISVLISRNQRGGREQSGSNTDDGAHILTPARQNDFKEKGINTRTSEVSGFR